MQDAAAVTSATRMLDGIRERTPPYEPDALDRLDERTMLEMSPGGQQRLPWDDNNAQVNSSRVMTGGPEDEAAFLRQFEREAQDEPDDRLGDNADVYNGGYRAQDYPDPTDLEELRMEDLRAAEGDPELGALAEPLQPNLPGVPRAQSPAARGDELATKMESLPTEGPDAPSSLTALITRLEEMLGRRLSDDEYRLLLKQQPQPGTSAPTPGLPF